MFEAEKIPRQYRIVIDIIFKYFPLHMRNLVLLHDVFCMIKTDFNSHVARIGRQHFVEIGLVAASDSSAKSFQELDRIRQEISDALGREGPGWWLTVDFTADKRWI